MRRRLPGLLMVQRQRTVPLQASFKSDSAEPNFFFASVAIQSVEFDHSWTGLHVGYKIV